MSNQIQFGIKFTGDSSGMVAATQRAKDSLDGIDKTAASVAGSTDRASVSLARMGHAAVAAFTVSRAIDYSLAVVRIGEQFTMMDSRLKLVTQSQHEFNRASEALFFISQRNGTALAGNYEMYLKLASSMRSLGGTQSQTLQMAELVSQSLRLSGAGAAQSAAATLQFSQAMGSGVLRGDEFNSMMENAPRLMQALARGMGQPIEALRKLAEEGQLTTDKVGNALLSQRGKIAGEFETLPPLVSTAWEKINNSFAKGVDNMNKNTGALTGMARLLDTIADKFSRYVGGDPDAKKNRVNELFTQISELKLDIAKPVDRGGIYFVDRFVAEAKTKLEAAKTEMSALLKVQTDELNKAAAESSSNKPLAPKAGLSDADQKARDEELKSYEKIIANGKEHLAVLAAQEQADHKLTAAEQKLAAFNSESSKFHDAKTVALRAAAKATLENSAEAERNAQIVAERNKQTMATAKLDHDHIKTAKDRLDALRLHNAEIGKSVVEVAALEAAQLNTAAATNEMTAANIEACTAQENLSAADKQRILDLKELARIQRGEAVAKIDGGVARKNTEDAKKSTEFAKGMSDNVAQSMTDGIMRGFENGKGFAENFTTSFANMIKTQVIETAIKGTMTAMMTQSMTQGAAMMNPYTAAAITAAVVAASVISSQSYNRGNKSAAEVQSVQATGTVFGDMAAKSATIADVSKAIKVNSDEGLKYSKGMLDALNQMTVNIGQFASLVVRTNPNLLNGQGLGIQVGQTHQSSQAGQDALLGGVGAAAGGIIGGIMTMGFGGGAGIAIGSAIGVGLSQVLGAFSKTEQSITDSGLKLSGTVADLKDGKGMRQYADSNSTTKDYWGLKSSTDANATQYGAVGNEFAQNFALIFNNLSGVMVTAGHALGSDTSTFASIIDKFPLDIKASLMNLKGQALADEISKVVSNISDGMSKKLFPSMEKYATLGEGYTQTVIRVANETEVVSVALDRIGVRSKPAATAMMDVAQSLIAAAGGADAYSSKMSFYSKNFLSEAQQLLPYQQALASAFADLNIVAPKTRTEFVGLMQAADLTTTSGQGLHNTLLNMAPAFDAVTKASDAAIKAAQDKAVADYQSAATAIGALKQFSAGLSDFKSALNLGALSPLTAKQKYDQTKTEFSSVNAAAASGDIAAQGKLQASATAFLDASRVMNASSAAYTSDFSAVQSSLTATKTAIGTVVTTAGRALAAAVSGNGFLDAIAANTLSTSNNITSLATALDSLPVAITDANGTVSSALVAALGDFNAAVTAAYTQLNSGSATAATAPQVTVPTATAAPVAAAAAVAAPAAVVSTAYADSQARIAAKAAAADAATAAAAQYNNWYFGAGHWDAGQNGAPGTVKPGKAHGGRGHGWDTAAKEYNDARISAMEAYNALPAFASGGAHDGGWRVVGETGWELENTGPSRIYSNAQSKSLLDTSDLLAELRELRREVAAKSNDAGGDLRLTVVTTDGKVLKEETLTELMRRSKNGEVVIHADGVAA